VSLETGVVPVFDAARSLYAGAGFTECPPFGPYRPDRHSTFLTLEL
jgi:putative acetyltransferase